MAICTTHWKPYSLEPFLLSVPQSPLLHKEGVEEMLLEGWFLSDVIPLATIF
jgi:hypothetical protein